MTHRGYVPLRPSEQEVLNKLIDRDQELYVEVLDPESGVAWGFHPSPDVRHGDRRIQVRFPMMFTKPECYTHVDEFTLKLKDRSGSVLYEETMDVDPPGMDGVWVKSGVTLDLVWDLWVDRISDDIVRKISPGPSGKEVMSVNHKTGEVSETEGNDD